MTNFNPGLTPLMIKAMDNAREGITISDATVADNPLIYVNQGFLTLSGYTFEEATNKNFRYLQGELTNTDITTRLREAIANNLAFNTDILNYRKDGSSFWNHLSITPIFDENGKVTNWIGIHEDISSDREKGMLQLNAFMQKTIAKTVVQSEIKERNRIGMELHDNINQMLVAANLYISLAKTNARFLDIAQDLVKDTIEEIRKLSATLVTEKETPTELVTVIKELIENSKPLRAFCY